MNIRIILIWQGCRSTLKPKDFFRRVSMKIQKWIRIFSIITVTAVSLTVFSMAQQPQGGGDKKVEIPSEDRTEAEKPEDSYLAKFHAQDVVEKLIRRNLEQIYLLNVIKTNFKDKGWGEQYDKVYKGYKDALDFYYKRRIIDARVKLEENRKAIGDLLRIIALEFNKETEAMLADCSTKILELHLDARTRSNPDKNNELNLNQMRLRIAYGQLDDGVNSFENHNYETAVYHYRVSKSYAIRILENIYIVQSDNTQKIAEKQKEAKEKYKVHKADNLNRIFEKKEEEKK